MFLARDFASIMLSVIKTTIDAGILAYNAAFLRHSSTLIIRKLAAFNGCYGNTFLVGVITTIAIFTSFRRLHITTSNIVDSHTFTFPVPVNVLAPFVARADGPFHIMNRTI